MKPISPPFQSQMWQLACVHNAERVALRKVTGVPHCTETNGSATYGGEEDWWGYELQSGQLAVLCLRVPYNDAVIHSDQQQLSDEIRVAFKDAIALGSLEIYSQAYPA